MSKTLPIVLVEDDMWLAEQFTRTLGDYIVHHAPHALAAIDLIDEVKPAAIILDVLLTGATAFTLLHELQSYTDTAMVPIILCTNMATELQLEELESYGVRRILDKATMRPDDLIAAVRSVTI
ncbi:MAG: response regulator [Candidatus Saccharimonadales bacterium]